MDPRLLSGFRGGRKRIHLTVTAGGNRAPAFDAINEVLFILHFTLAYFQPECHRAKSRNRKMTRERRAVTAQRQQKSIDSAKPIV